MKYKALIFDFNGTLFWDTALHNLAWDNFLEKHKIVMTDEEKAIKIHGRSNKDILKSIFNGQLSSEQVHSFSVEKELMYQQIVLNEQVTYAPGVPELFESLKKLKVPYAIATSSDWVNIDFYIKHRNLLQFIDIEYIIYENGTFLGKPNPDIYYLAMQKLSVEPHETIIFEDSPIGIMAAENAGAGQIIIVNSSGRDYSHLPYTIINHFDDFDRDLLQFG